MGFCIDDIDLIGDILSVVYEGGEIEFIGTSERRVIRVFDGTVYNPDHIG
jgi:hypothetical protein